MTSESLFRHALQQQEAELRGCHVDLPSSGREELGGDGNGCGSHFVFRDSMSGNIYLKIIENYFFSISKTYRCIMREKTTFFNPIEPSG
jgi:hypothetical protein